VTISGAPSLHADAGEDLEEFDRDRSLIADCEQFADHFPAEPTFPETPETRLRVEEGAPGGSQLRVISGVTPRMIRVGGRTLGRWFEDENARYCTLGNILPDDVGAPKNEQTLQVLETMQRALGEAGMDFHDVVRTWFYNEDILGWYAPFNRARREFFERNSITRIPASTGIGVANAAGAALVGKLIAVSPKNDKVTIRRVESPLQCDAAAYGSAFARAMEVADPVVRMLYVSGTASIAPGGETVHATDTLKQIAKTMEVVTALLENNGMALGDTVRAIGYFRKREDIPLWKYFCARAGLPPIPILLTESTVCRRNLLFEIELDAARTQE
jgi:enamine deaminase RidA (YjgF/YER057c/UK114 family)